MLLDFFQREKGGLAYAMRDPTAQVLYGLPALTHGLLESISGRQRYTAGVLSEIIPLGDEVREKAIRGAEYQFRAGLPKESLDITWIRHTGKKRDEFHFVAPNIELLTGKPYSPYIDRIDRHRFKAWQELFNLQHNLPDPSSRLRVMPDYSKSRLSGENQKFLNDVWCNLDEKVTSGLVTNRAEIIAYLRSIGHEVRAETYAGKPLEQPVVTLPGGVQLRLKGSLYYRKNFSPSLLNQQQESLNPETVKSRIIELRATIAKGLNFRAYHTIGHLFGCNEQRRVEPGRSREHLAELLQIKLRECGVSKPIHPIFGDDGIKNIVNIISFTKHNEVGLGLTADNGADYRNSEPQALDSDLKVLSEKNSSKAVSVDAAKPSLREGMNPNKTNPTSDTDPLIPLEFRKTAKPKNDNPIVKPDFSKPTPPPDITIKTFTPSKKKKKKTKNPELPGDIC